MNTSLAEQITDWHELNGAKPLNHRTADDERKAQNAGILSYNSDTLDWIHRVFSGPSSERIDQNDANFMADLEHGMKMMVSMAGAHPDDQYDEGVRMCAYEVASGFCYTAWFNGTRTRENLRKAENKVGQFKREFDGSEVRDTQMQRAIENIERWEHRLWFWRSYFKVAARVYEQTVRELDFDFLAPKWTPPVSKRTDDKADKGRKLTFTAAQAAYYSERAEQDFRRKRALEETVNEPVDDHFAYPFKEASMEYPGDEQLTPAEYVESLYEG